MKPVLSDECVVFLGPQTVGFIIEDNDFFLGGDPKKLVLWCFIIEDDDFTIKRYQSTCVTIRSALDH